MPSNPTSASPQAAHPAGVSVILTQAQVECIATALETFSRIGIGQVGEVAEMVRDGLLSGPATDGATPAARLDTKDAVASLCDDIAHVLGFAPGASRGIASPAVHEQVRRAWEIRKQLVKFLALRRNPDPREALFSVNYDGRLLHLTQDPDIGIADAPARVPAKPTHPRSR